MMRAIACPRQSGDGSLIERQVEYKNRFGESYDWVLIRAQDTHDFDLDVVI